MDKEHRLDPRWSTKTPLAEDLEGDEEADESEEADNDDDSDDGDDGSDEDN